MQSLETLPRLLAESARRYPNRVAVENGLDGAISYLDLDVLSDRVRDRLRRMGVKPGDRVGIYLEKSIDAVAAIFGIMKAGAAYVPVDASAPAWRCAYILNDCSVAAAVIESKLTTAFTEETGRLGPTPPLLVLEGSGGGGPLRDALEREEAREPVMPAPDATLAPDDIAYILYTSGSTGKPKGVVLSHRNAMTFVNWCAETFRPTEDDRFSSHAPFHFDLSILDIYVPIMHGATLVLIGSDLGKEPTGLAAFISERRITCWYSTPSILSILAQYGKLPRHDYSALRIVHFAGEVFPVKHLRLLRSLIPHPRYFNLYGPTETNVCTWFEIPREIPEQRTQPFPIGAVCSPFQARVVDEEGNDVPAGSEGELCIAGPGVMQGYWNLPERTAAAFLVGADGIRWYKTGDIVVGEADGNFVYMGRRDRMVKRRGYRIELGEIEAGLYRHPTVKEAAVVAVKDNDGGVRIKAFLSCRDADRPTVIELKRFCADLLPASMIPDSFVVELALPKTSTDKVDYQRLMEMT